MNLLEEHNKKYQFFVDITGIAMAVYNKFVGEEHRRQLKNYLNITHIPYGMLINFSPNQIYSEWYERFPDGTIERIKLF